MEPKEILQEAKKTLSEGWESPKKEISGKNKEKTADIFVKKKDEKPNETKKTDEILKVKKIVKRPNVDFRMLDEVSKILTSLVPKKKPKINVKKTVKKLTKDDMAKIKILKIEEQRAKKFLNNIKKMQSNYEKDAYDSLVKKTNDEITELEEKIKKITTGSS